MSAFSQAIELRPLGGNGIAAAPEGLIVKETNNLILQYDTRDAKDIDKVAFASLLNSKDTVNLGVRCDIVTPKGQITIGGNRTYSIKAPHALR